MKKNGVSKRSIVASVILLAVIIFMAVSYIELKPRGIPGEKTITVEVVHKDGTRKSFDITTMEQFLRPALDSIELIDGQDSGYGMFLTTVDGEVADSNVEEWWGTFKDGKLTSFSIDQQPIADKEKYEIRFITGWDNY